MPTFTHRTCHFIQFISQTAPSLLNRWFTFRINEPMTYLHKCGYHRHFLGQEITRAKDITRKAALLSKNATTTTMDKSECIKFLVTYSRHLSATSHLDLIPLLPQHIQVCTYCCLPTQQQPRQLSCTSETTQPFTKHRTPEALFNATATVPHAPTYETGLPLTYSLSSAKEDLLLTTLPATLKTLVTGFSANPIKRYIEEWKWRLKDHLNKHHRPGSWQAHQDIRKFPHWSSHR